MVHALFQKFSEGSMESHVHSSGSQSRFRRSHFQGVSWDPGMSQGCFKECHGVVQWGSQENLGAFQVIPGNLRGISMVFQGVP